MSTNDYSHGYADGAGQAHEQRGEEIEAIRARVAELEKENTTIRALLVKYECPYGEKSLGECSRGFPGCACADDMLATASWCPEDEDKAAVRLGRRVAELEANNEGSLKAAAYWKENWQRSEAHAATLREALEEAAAHMWGNQKRCGCLNECIHTGEVVRAALAATPAASLAAHDAEVGMRVVSECAMTMRSKCNCTHCDENAPGWEGRAIVERALAAQEVKP